MLRNFVLSFSDNFEKLVLLGVIKRQITETHGIEDDSDTPNVSFHRVVAFATEHLRTGVAGTSACAFESLSLAEDVA